MIKYTNMRFLVFCILISSFHFHSFAQKEMKGLDEKINFANELAQHGNYKTATKYYLKAYFTDRENLYPELSLKIAKGFDSLEDYPNAIKYTKIYSKQKNIDIQNKLNAKYYEIQLHLRQKEIQIAKAQLLQMESELIMHDQDRYNFYVAILSLNSDEYKNFISAIHDLSYFHKFEFQELKYITTDFRLNINKNHKKARWLSALIPGLGHAVNDDVPDGINSFIVNAGFAGVFIHVANQLSLIDAIVSVGPWFGRYYGGGMKNAVKASKKKQIETREKLIRDFTIMCLNAKS